MEVTGLVLSVAGVVGLFGACIDAFQLFRKGAELGIEYEILITKLDVEKTRLLQWGEGVGLLDECHRDPRIDNPVTRQTLEGVLNCINLLLTKSEDLGGKYGLKDVEDDQVTTTGLISRRRFLTFKESHSRFQMRARMLQKSTSVYKKTCWAISDQEKFRLFLSDLRDFVTNLDDIVPVRPSFQRLMVREDIEDLPDNITQLRILEKACEDGPDNWSEAASLKVEQSLMGTSDRRNIQEWLEDTRTEYVSNIEPDGDTASLNSSGSAGSATSDQPRLGQGGQLVFPDSEGIGRSVNRSVSPFPTRDPAFIQAVKNELYGPESPESQTTEESITMGMHNYIQESRLLERLRRLGNAHEGSNPQIADSLQNPSDSLKRQIEVGNDTERALKQSMPLSDTVPTHPSEDSSAVKRRDASQKSNPKLRSDHRPGFVGSHFSTPYDFGAPLSAALPETEAKFSDRSGLVGGADMSSSAVKMPIQVPKGKTGPEGKHAKPQQILGIQQVVESYECGKITLTELAEQLIILGHANYEGSTELLRDAVSLPLEVLEARPEFSPSFLGRPATRSEYVLAALDASMGASKRRASFSLEQSDYRDCPRCDQFVTLIDTRQDNKRVFRLPYALAKEWTSFEDLLFQAFEKEVVHGTSLGSLIDEGQYDLILADGKYIMRQLWDHLVEPGWEVHIELRPDALPSPRRLGLDLGGGDGLCMPANEAGG